MIIINILLFPVIFQLLFIALLVWKLDSQNAKVNQFLAKFKKLLHNPVRFT